MNISNYIRCAGCILILILGISSSNISASIKDELKYNADRIWRVLPKLTLMGAKGAVAVCSCYLTIKWGYYTCKACKGLKNSHSDDLCKDILEKGCLTVGVGLLAYETGGSFLRDLEKL